MTPAGSEHDQPARRAASLLGLAGALPFVALALVLWWLSEPRGQWALQALIAYGAVILSFLGGIHWGLALRDAPEDGHAFVISVIPSLLAWTALLLPHTFALSLLAVCFVGQLALDLRLHVARWFRLLRVALTVVACTSLLLASMAPTAS